MVHNTQKEAIGEGPQHFPMTYANMHNSTKKPCRSEAKV